MDASKMILYGITVFFIALSISIGQVIAAGTFSAAEQPAVEFMRQMLPGFTGALCLLSTVPIGGALYKSVTTDQSKAISFTLGGSLFLQAPAGVVLITMGTASVI